MYEITRQRRFNKKGLLLIGILIMLPFGAFYGCQMFQQSPDPAQMNDQMPLYRRIGVLKSLGGVRTSNSGTHLLQMDDGNTLLLKSLQINLDDPGYLGKTVEVRGILNYTNDKSQIMEVMNIDLVQEDAALTSMQVNWKELENRELEILIRYRDDLTMSSENGAVVFTREFYPEEAETGEMEAEAGEMEAEAEVTDTVMKIKHRFEIARVSPGEGKTMFSAAGLREGEEDILSAGVTRSRVGSGSYDSLKSTEADVTTYFIQAGKHVYVVKIDAGNDERTLEDQNLFYEMLSSLRISAAAAVQTDDDTVNDPVVATDEGVTQTVLTEDKEVPPETGTEAVPTAEANIVKDLSALEGYEKLESESFKFSMLYPKSWYFSGSSSPEANVIRHYNFGKEPLEEVPGHVSMDLMSGTVPAGSSSVINGKEITIVSTSDGVEIYVGGAGSRIYRFKGPVSTQSTLINMAVSIAD